MQILDYDDKNNTHVCLNCDTEFSVVLINNDDDELGVEFCPCCGASLEEEIDELDIDDDIDYDN